jgi:hypothetical protein
VRDQHGQASVEWIALLLVVTVALVATLAFVPSLDGRPLGAALARTLVCAVRKDCHSEGAALRRAYGDRDAQLVRANAPNLVYEPGTLTLPVDYRRCRSHRCSDAPDDRDLDVSRSARGGMKATAYTPVVHRGGYTYVQYWLYYPDSPSTFLHSHGILKALGLHDPGFHPDDWESFEVRIDRAGEAAVRASAHGHWQWCKHIWCKNHWGPGTGWTRISRGSHAGHIPLRMKPRVIGIDYEPVRPGAGLRERSTAAPGLHLVPLETLDHRTYKPLRGGIEPPWTKKVYGNPESDTS